MILIFHEAIHTPDTFSYLHANIYRSPGYVIFVKLFQVVFKDYFDFFTVGFQLLFGLFATHLVLTKVSKALNLHIISEFIFLAILIFPFFAPLYIANNICSEGLSYPLYLLFIAFTADFFTDYNQNSFRLLSATFILLALTRGQFIVLPIIIAVIYIIKIKKLALRRYHLKNIGLLFLIPVLIILMDKSYHKLKDGLFVSTPFTNICLSGAAFYVSDASDIESIENKDDKIIFKDCYGFLEENNWLLSSKKRDSYTEYYKHFHNNLGNICNYTVHDRGTEYYLNQGFDIREARVGIENSSGDIVKVLIKNNFSKWIKLYYSNLVHGFKSELLMFFILLVFIFSGIKFLFSRNNYMLYLFLFSSLILSNALIVALAGHSIMRYLFYNYSLFFLILIILLKLLKHEKKA
ncbi:hypothetical protein OS188_09495 [Xanthomarina sp. F1114]|uniref:hypothetical protein n=1 Tax=Xanthomarina sp. F1114 TaxID=2996019 RepID=UPI00225DE419|nr:hypothetical protein [Xanthomarina sp. F1114]MCX7548187.1 hypothetical protein [Xanthomarina sp. F1114]